MYEKKFKKFRAGNNDDMKNLEEKMLSSTCKDFEKNLNEYFVEKSKRAKLLKKENAHTL